MGGTPNEYRPEIDGLRCIAVMSVILYHSGLGLVPGGYVGVDIFFVISGFLITGIINREITERRFSFVTFYERRIRRIFPALFLVMAVSIPAAWVLLTPVQLKEFFQSLVATTLFASNIFFRIKSGYFSADAETIPMLHMWSLAVEEQFYILFPILLIIVARVRRAWLGPVLIAGVVLSFAYCLYKQPVEPMGAFFLLPSRAWELGIGAIVAIYRDRWLTLLQAAPKWRSAIEAAGFAMIVVPLFAYSSATPFPGVATVPPVVGTAMVILVSQGTGAVGGLLVWRPVVGIGLISYSAYLWHQPLFAFARAIVVTHVPMGLAVVLVVLTLTLAYLSWRFVEQPFRSRDTVSRIRIFQMGGAASAAMIGIGLVGHFGQGFPQRFDAPTLALAATTTPSPERLKCHTDGLAYRKPEAACRYGGAKVDWALFGDSHVIETGAALAEHLTARGEGVVHLSFSGCPPVTSLVSPNPGCTAWMRESSGWLLRQPEIKNVFVAFRHSFYLYGDQTKTYPTLPDVPPAFADDRNASDAREIYWRDFSAVISAFSAAGKRVYVVLPLPELPVSIDRYIYGGKAGAAETPGSWYDRRHAQALARIDALGTLPGVTILDPRLAVCGAVQCRAIINDEAMYFDDNHFSMSAARRFIAAEVARGRLP